MLIANLPALVDRTRSALASNAFVGDEDAVRIPSDSLKPETLRALIEEFVTREGTEYGDGDVSLDDKVAAVKAQLDLGTAIILYDEESQTCTVAEAAQKQEGIQLDQFLKHENLVSTGGQAKAVIQGGEVTVNGAVETRRKLKLKPGDRIGYGGRTAVVPSA